MKKLLVLVMVGLFTLGLSLGCSPEKPDAPKEGEKVEEDAGDKEEAPVKEEAPKKKGE